MSAPRMYLKKVEPYAGMVVVTICETEPASHDHREWLRRHSNEGRPEKGAHIHQIMTLQEVVEWSLQVTRMANACIEFDRRMEKQRKEGRA